MNRITLQEVRSRCTEGRFFSYTDWHDRTFAPPSVILVWVFVRIGWTGNAVSALSGAVALIGASLVASQRPGFVLFGSFGYMTFYLLDYVDGGVARFRRETGIAGQYMDWMMHVVAAVGFAGGLFAGALRVAGPWIIPFGVLSVVAAALALDRYAIGWFSICMHYQQQRVKGTVEPMAIPTVEERPVKSVAWVLRSISTLLFHESYAILLLPLLASSALLPWHSPIDFRVVLTVLGGGIYFPVVAHDIWSMASSGRIDRAYAKLFFGKAAPRLPDEHFLG